MVTVLTFSIMTFKDENNIQEWSGTFASVVYSNHESLCTNSGTCTWLSGRYLCRTRRYFRFRGTWFFHLGCDKHANILLSRCLSHDLCPHHATCPAPTMAQPPPSSAATSPVPSVLFCLSPPSQSSPTSALSAPYPCRQGPPSLRATSRSV